MAETRSKYQRKSPWDAPKEIMRHDKDDERAHKAEATKSHFQKNKSVIEHQAEKWANADRSDPFARDRVVSHYRNGVATQLDDYDCEFKMVKVGTSAKGEDYKALRPFRMVRP